MADLSQLSDEQLQVYKDLLLKKNGGAEESVLPTPGHGLPDIAPPPPLPDPAGYPGDAIMAQDAEQNKNRTFIGPFSFNSSTPEATTVSGFKQLFTPPSSMRGGGIPTAGDVLENISGGGNKIFKGTLPLFGPMAIPAFLEAPAAGLTGLLTGTGVGFGTDYLGSKTQTGKDHPETLQFLSTLLGGMAGNKAANKVQQSLMSRIAAERNVEPREAVNEITGILRPGQNDQDFHDSVKAAAPLIKQYEPSFQRTSPNLKENLAGIEPPPTSGVNGPTVNPKSPEYKGSAVRSVYHAANLAQDDLMSLMEQMIDPLDKAGATVPGKTIADAMRASLQSGDVLPHEISPAMWDKISIYDQTPRVPIREALSQLKASNKALNGFFDKSIENQGLAMQTVGDTIAERARGDALRHAIYNTLDQAGNGQAPAQVMKLWGQTNDVKYGALRRLNEAISTNPEQSALGRALGMGKAVGMAMSGRNPVGPAIQQFAVSAYGAPNGIDDSLINAFMKVGEAKPLPSVPITPGLNSAPLPTSRQIGPSTMPYGTSGVSMPDVTGNILSGVELRPPSPYTPGGVGRKQIGPLMLPAPRGIRPNGEPTSLGGDNINIHGGGVNITGQDEYGRVLGSEPGNLGFGSQHSQVQQAPIPMLPAGSHNIVPPPPEAPFYPLPESTPTPLRSNPVIDSLRNFYSQTLKEPELSTLEAIRKSQGGPPPPRAQMEANPLQALTPKERSSVIQQLKANPDQKAIVMRGTQKLMFGFNNSNNVVRYR